MAELVDAVDSKSTPFRRVLVRFQSSAFELNMKLKNIFFLIFIGAAFFVGIRYDKIVKCAYSCRDILSDKPYLPRKLRKQVKRSAGIVIDSKRVKIREVDHPYNASIIQRDGDSLLLFFRYDVPESFYFFENYCKFKTFIGVVGLDKDFNQIDNSLKIIDTNSFFSEDPRAFKVKDDIFLTYNELQPCKGNVRVIKLAALEKDTFDVKYTTNFDQYIRRIEKNWTTFVYDENPFFVYQVNPHKILKIKDPQSSHLEHLLFDGYNPYIKDRWFRNWGTLKGGTPALLVDGEYLSFFHSSFEDKKKGYIWYVMGAYTFEAKPPFKITAISRGPIMFEGIYDTPKRGFCINKNLYCIFPSGFVIGKRDGRDVFYVSCGENDSGVKILTIDKEKLFQSLRKIETK